jgi:hypothetical protein
MVGMTAAYPVTATRVRMPRLIVNLLNPTFLIVAIVLVMVTSWILAVRFRAERD